MLGLVSGWQLGLGFANSPVSAALEVVCPSGLLVLYGLSVKRVYTVPVVGLEGSNLRVCLSYDGIVGWCHYLVPPVVVNDGFVSRSVLVIPWISFVWWVIRKL